MSYNDPLLKLKEILEMMVKTNVVEVVNEKPMRVTRLVSVILNGVVLSKLAEQNGNDVDAIANTLLSNLSDNVQNNIYPHEIPLVGYSLRMEIGRRINLPQAV
jgi:uncharacterized protein with ParB-like and HNH nuclease domain